MGAIGLRRGEKLWKYTPYLYLEHMLLLVLNMF